MYGYTKSYSQATSTYILPSIVYVYLGSIRISPGWPLYTFTRILFSHKHIFFGDSNIPSLCSYVTSLYVKPSLMLNTYAYIHTTLCVTAHSIASVMTSYDITVEVSSITMHTLALEFVTWRSLSIPAHPAHVNMHTRSMSVLTSYVHTIASV